MARSLADSDETHAAVVEQLFQYLVKQPIRAFGPNTHHELTRSLVKHNFNIRRLAVEIATAAAFRPTVPARSP